LLKDIYLAAASSVLVVSFNIKSRKIIMKTRMQPASSQKGFSLLTGFILAIIMFGTLAFFLAGQGINSGFGTAYSNTSKVSGLVTSGGYVNTGFDAVTMGGTTADKVTFDVTALTGVFNPTTGGASQQTLDPTLFARASAIDGYWVYRGNDITMKGVGVAATPDYTMLVSGLKLSVCQQINNTLHGTPLTGGGSSPVSLGALDAAIVGAPTATTPSVALISTNAVPFDQSAVVAATSGWMNGCYSTTTSVGTGVNYVYIHTLLAQ
jgi:hypothetical protein